MKYKYIKKDMSEIEEMGLKCFEERMKKKTASKYTCSYESGEGAIEIRKYLYIRSFVKGFLEGSLKVFDGFEPCLLKSIMKHNEKLSEEIEDMRKELNEWGEVYLVWRNGRLYVWDNIFDMVSFRSGLFL